jgi:hypothetical protein
MTYRIEDIIRYVDAHADDYSFAIREYCSPQGEYHNEAVVFYPLISDTIGIILADMPFNPVIYYTEQDILAVLAPLEAKARRIAKLLHKATIDFNHYVGSTPDPRTLAHTHTHAQGKTPVQPEKRQ